MERRIPLPPVSVSRLEPAPGRGAAPPEDVERILVTGASGVIGHYIVETLLRETRHRLVLLVRDPSRLPPAMAGNGRVQILVADLRALAGHEETIRRCTSAVLAAANWDDGPSSDAVNVDATLSIMEILRESACRRVIYFSTASILDSSGEVSRAAGEIGTPYVRSKHRMREILDQRDDLPPTAILYPTLVLAGDLTRPRSHVAHLLAELVKRRQLLRWFSVDASVHFTHAVDVAQVVSALLECAPAALPRHVILGGPALRVDDAVDALLAHQGLTRIARVPLSASLARALVALFRVKLAAWDRHCLAVRHFTYRDAVGPRSFGRRASFEDLGVALTSLLASP